VNSSVQDFSDLSAIQDDLSGYDACFFLSRRLVGWHGGAGLPPRNYDLTMSVARILASQNPDMIFIYVSGNRHRQLPNAAAHDVGAA